MPMRDFLSRQVLKLVASALPASFRVNGWERLRAVSGAGLGVLLTALISHAWSGSSATQPWLVAPIGASAVLIFAVPSSPLAQPWAVVGGLVISTFVGSVCATLIPDPSLAGAIAVSLAITLMFALRCLHPPGGAAALLAALSGAPLSFVIFPVLFNCVLVVLAGMLYNPLTGRRYPHVSARASVPVPGERFTAADLDAALAHYNQVVDISRDDLQALLHHAEAAAYERRFSDLRCRDIMTRSPLTAEFGTPLEHAWATMRQARVKALPVIDRGGHIAGIVTVADFMRHAGIDRPQGIVARLKQLMTPSGKLHTEKPEVVGQLMTKSVRVARVDRRISELVPLFSEGGHHHLPVVDERQKLVGIITQTDLIRALSKEAAPSRSAR